MANSPRPPVEALRRMSSGITYVIVGFVVMGIISLMDDDTWVFLLPLVLSTIGLLRIQRGIDDVAHEGEVGERVAAMRTREPQAAMPTKPEPDPFAAERPLSASSLPPKAPVKEQQEPWKRKEIEWASNIDWEEWVGKKLLQKLGIVIVLIGMIVFLKYSFDNGWIGILGRISLAAIVGVAMLGAGEFFVMRYGRWAHAFTGGGLAMLFFTVWAADSFYATELSSIYGLNVNPMMAMVLYSAITLMGAFASIRYKDQAVAWFAMLGGYLTPAIIDSPVANPMGLSVYLVVLAAGVMLLAWHQRWKYLNVAAFILTQMYLLSQVYPSAAISNPEQVGIAIGFFLLFGILPFIYQFRLRLPAQGDDVFLTVANGGIVAWVIVDAMGGIASEYTGLVLLAIAAVYMMYSAMSLLKRSEDDTLVNTYLVASIILIALALLAELRFEWVAVGWAPLSLLLVFVAARTQRSGPWICATTLLVASLGALMLNTPTLGLTEEYIWHPFTSRWALQNYVVYASLIGWIFLTRQLPKKLLADENGKTLQSLLHTLMAGTLFLAVTFEVTKLQWTVDLPWTLGYLGFAAVALAVFWFVRSIVWFAAAFIAQILVLGFIFAFGERSGMEFFSIFGGGPLVTPFAHPWGYASLLALGMTLAIAFVAASQRDERLNNLNMRTVLIFASLAQVWLHVTVEIQHLARTLQWTSTVLDRVLSGWWIALPAAMIIRSAYSNNHRLRKGAIAALCIPLIKDLFLIADASAFQYEAVVWTIVPLCLMILGTRSRQELLCKAGIAMLVATATIDMLFHFGYDAGLIRTVWWAAAALTTIVAGFTEREQSLRRVGILIFGAVTAKLLLIDFSVLVVPARIGATIGTGLLMIGASYLYQRFDTIFGDTTASKAPKNRS